MAQRLESSLKPNMGHQLDAACSITRALQSQLRVRRLHVEASLMDQLAGVELGDEPADGARIQLRMPDGKRKVRRFDKSGAVKYIYAFVAQSDDDAKGGKEFVLMAGHPPKDLLESIDSTVEDCKLSGQAIMVRWK